GCTGYRVGELASLVVGSFELDADPPVVRCEASFCKNGQPAIQPLPQFLVPLLRSFLAGRSRQRVWPGSWSEKASKMIQHDLIAARAAWVAAADNDAERKRRQESEFCVYQNEAGHFADFHALRK